MAVQKWSQSIAKEYTSHFLLNILFCVSLSLWLCPSGVVWMASAKLLLLKLPVIFSLKGCGNSKVYYVGLILRANVYNVSEESLCTKLQNEIDYLCSSKQKYRKISIGNSDIDYIGNFLIEWIQKQTICFLESILDLLPDAPYRWTTHHQLGIA